MITVDEALSIMDRHIPSFGVEVIGFEDCLNRRIAENVTADRDFPPYHRAAMDGIAILFEDFQKGHQSFRVVGEQVAGLTQQSLQGEATCLEIMTGAILPKGADTIIRYEDVTIENGQAVINIDEVKEKGNIHHQGTDCQIGDVLIPKGKQINIGDIGIITSVGKSKVKVSKRPKVAVISTGNELVEVDQIPEPYQIRKSNVHTISSLLKQEGVEHELFHFDDDFEVIKSGLERIISKYEVILMSGGVSMGKKDFIPEALEAVGVKKYFHRIKQRPGKPLWFGGNEKVTVFGFPGNPVSTLVCYIAYFKRWLNKTIGIEPGEELAELAVEVVFKPNFFYYLPVSLHHEGSRLVATPHRGHGSGDLVNLSKMEAFICLPEGKEVFEKGEVYPIRYPV